MAGIKYDDGKPPVALLDGKFLLEVAKVMGYGAQKYSAHNWRTGMAYSRLISATYRHMIAFNSGQDLDDESGLPHLAHAAANIMMLMGQNEKHDDRWKPPVENGETWLARLLS